MCPFVFVIAFSRKNSPSERERERERDSIFVFRLKNVTKIFYRWAQFVSLGGWFILYLLEVYVE